METIYGILQEELTSLAKAIIRNIDKLGMNATGRTKSSLEVVQDGAYHGTLYGRKYFGALETGRRPTTGAVTIPSLYECILEWVDAKGIQPRDADTSIESLAWAITKNIHKFGTRLYRSGGRKDVFSNEIPKTIDNINNRISEFFLMRANDINEQIAKHYSQLNTQ